MQATIRLADGARLVQVEGETQADLFEQMAQAYEVFNETNCGLCGSANIRPIVRVVDKYRFYEYICCEPNCWAKLTFGQSQEVKGSLFPKRKLLENGKPDLKEGSYGEHNGWTKYRGDNRQEDSNWPAESRPAPQTGLPPESSFQELRNLLGDIGVGENEAGFRNQVVRYVTKNKLDFGQCAKSEEHARHAIERLNAGLKHFGGGDQLIVKVQEWMSGGK